MISTPVLSAGSGRGGASSGKALLDLPDRGVHEGTDAVQAGVGGELVAQLGVNRVELDDPLQLDLSVPSDEVLPVVSALVSSAPHGLTVTPANLDDLFWQRYEGNLR